MLIRAASRNEDGMLNFILLQKDEKMHVLDTSMRAKLNYLVNSPLRTISLSLSRLRARIWNALNISSPARREIKKLEMASIPPKPKLSDFKNLFTEAMYISDKLNTRERLIYGKKDKKSLQIKESLTTSTIYNKEIAFLSDGLNHNLPIDEEGVMPQLHNSLALNKSVNRQTYFDSLWFSYEYYLRTLLNKRQWRDAFSELVDIRFKMHRSPSLNLYKRFVRVLGNKKEINLMKEILLMMRTDGVTISSSLYEYAISACMDPSTNKAIESTIHRLTNKGNTNLPVRPKPRLETNNKTNTFEEISKLDKLDFANRNLNKKMENPTNYIYDSETQHLSFPEQAIEIYHMYTEYRQQRAYNMAKKQRDNTFTNNNSKDSKENVLINNINTKPDYKKSEKDYLSPLSLRTAYYLTQAILTAPIEFLPSLKTPEIDDNEISQLLEDYFISGSDELRIKSIIQFYCSELDFELGHSSLIAGIDELVGNARYVRMMVKLPLECFRISKMDNKVNQIVDNARLIGLRL
ncbi:hypothetical protein BB558_002161 [Smittium angustum]|uniref:Uncharacterized protein n=2 Tax=Smittium angustum TaxID=133377 RepID=A0A2U1J9F0_SMIAN|nr:hypothetical protein BB558_002161 [Smittium angustum]